MCALTWIILCGFQCQPTPPHVRIYLQHEKELLLGTQVFITNFDSLACFYVWSIDMLHVYSWSENLLFITGIKHLQIDNISLMRIVS